MSVLIEIGVPFASSSVILRNHVGDQTSKSYSEVCNHHLVMKHGIAFRKFSRTSSHRMLMLR